jgi:hypothetical protein
MAADIGSVLRQKVATAIFAIIIMVLSVLPLFKSVVGIPLASFLLLTRKRRKVVN